MLRGYRKKIGHGGMMGAFSDRGLRIPEKLLRQWNIRYPNVLESTLKHGGAKPFKFSYHLKFWELLFAPPGVNHKSMILNYGSYPFAEYVRGIYFRERKIIYLRMHEKLDWMRKTVEIFEINELGDQEVKFMWGRKAAEELREELRGL